MLAHRGLLKQIKTDLVELKKGRQEEGRYREARDISRSKEWHANAKPT